MLHVSILVISILLGVLVLADVRLNTLGEPFGDHLMAISIAISRLVYDAKGLVGLEQVLAVLKQIPSVSALNLNSIPAYENYQLVINEALQKATLLSNIDYNQVHAYLNDQAYLYYVMIAFLLFGIKLKVYHICAAIIVFGFLQKRDSQSFSACGACSFPSFWS